MRRRRSQPETTLADAYLDLRADYNAAKSSRFRKRLTGVSTMGSGADFHIRSWTDNLRMMELSRSFDRNDPIVGQGLTRLIRNVIQGGMKLNPETGSVDLDAEWSHRWKAYTTHPDQCDRTGEHDFTDLTKLELRHTFVDGDILKLFNQAGTIELVEAHRLRTPSNTRKNVVHGVRLDKKRRHREYWVTRENIEPHRQVTKVSEIQRIRVHDAETGVRIARLVALPKRISQTRGITVFAPIVDTVGMHDDIQFAKLVQQQVASCFAIFRQREGGTTTNLGDQTGAQTTETLSDGSTRTIEGIAPGMEITGEPGETLQGFSPNIPNPEFFPHAMLILTFIAINLDQPVHMLLLDPSKTNFSGWRGAMDQAKIGFRDLQRFSIMTSWRPTYEWQVGRWLRADDKLRALAEQDGVDAYAHGWAPPSWPYVEPSKDAKAEETIVSNRLNSRRGVLALRGLDIEKVDAEIVTDNATLVTQAIKAADEINTKSPKAKVGWRELAGFATVGSATQNVSEPSGRGDANLQASVREMVEDVLEEDRTV